MNISYSKSVFFMGCILVLMTIIACNLRGDEGGSAITSGILKLIAGKTTVGTSDGTGVDAEYNNPTRITFDSAG